METIECEARKWGNSIGMIIPKDVVDREKIKENDKVHVLIIRDSSVALKNTFGMAKNKLKISGQEIKGILRKELYD